MSVEGEGWSCTDTLSYTIPPLDGAGDNGVFLLFQTEGYNYENIAFDVCVLQDTFLLYHEQHCYLLDEQLSVDGIGRRSDYTLPIGNFTLCDTLPTSILLVHRVDQPVLTGVRNVGIRISAPMHRPGEPVWRVDWR